MDIDAIVEALWEWFRRGRWSAGDALPIVQPLLLPGSAVGPLELGMWIGNSLELRQACRDRGLRIVRDTGRPGTPWRLEELLI